MPDLPDDYPFLPGSVRFPLADLGELAARLGSPMLYDRRGEVIWSDTFRGGLAPWDTAAVGTGASVDIVADKTDLSPFAARLTGGSTGSGSIAIARYFDLLTLSKTGFELSILAPTAYDVFYMRIVRHDGSLKHIAEIKGTFVGGTLAYLDENGVYQTFGTPGLWATTANNYDNLKLVADFEKDEWVRVLFGGVEYDLSGIQLETGIVSLNDVYEASFQLSPRSGQNDYVQIGRAIVTDNEP